MQREKKSKWDGWKKDAHGIVTHDGHMNNATIAVEKGLENLAREERYAREHPYDSRAQARVKHMRENLPPLK